MPAVGLVRYGRPTVLRQFDLRQRSTG